MPTEKQPTSASEIQSMGGKARAESMTPQRRSEIAKKAAEAKWDIPRATHTGLLEIAGTTIECHNLPDGTRLLSRIGVLKAIGRTGKAKGGRAYDEEFGLPVFLTAKNLKPFITNDLTKNSEPVRFLPKGGGVPILGYRAEILPQICGVFIDADEAVPKVTTSMQEHIVKRCKILLRGFATVGIIALVDEATGFQYERPRNALEEQLKKFLSENLRQWVQTFPADYFKHLCRLRNVEMRPDMVLPQYFGHLTNDLIYRRIAPRLLKSLKERRLERGKPSNKLHSWLSEDIGLRAILVHLGTVVGLMKINTDYKQFKRQLDQVAPIYLESPGLFDNPKDWDEQK